MVALLGVKSTLLNNYVLPTLDEFQYDAAIIHVRINDILPTKTENDLKKLPNKINDISRTCQNYDVRKAFIFVNLTITQKL